METDVFTRTTTVYGRIRTIETSSCTTISNLQSNDPSTEWISDGCTSHFQYQPRKRNKTTASTHPPPIAVSSSSSLAIPSANLITAIPSHSLIAMKEQPQTPPPTLPQPPPTSTGNPNDPISLLVATLFDQKLAMFASNFQQFNIDHLQYHFTPPNTQLYPTPAPMPFDPVAFLAKQQQHRLV